jgi:lactate dehydrogenase-like 2-hydroxyacid dehydrogenase
VIVTRMLPGGIPDVLAALEPWVWGEDRALPADTLGEVIGDATGLLSMLTDRIDAALLDRAPRLRVISQMAVGVDNIDLEACRARGLLVGHTPDVLTETTADTAFALLAAAVRRLPEGWDHVRSGAWGEWKPDLLLGGDLHGTTLGIVGLGRIGQAVARRARGFGMRLLYAGRNRKPPVEAELGIAHRSLPELLAESDHVMLTASYDDSNHHLFDRAAFAAMKEGATFVNVARGGLVDHDALAQALANGWIGRAALDVTDPEPIPAGHALVGLANCLIVPHIGSASHRTRLAMARLAVDNLLAGLEGRELPAPLPQVQAVG